MRRPPPGETVLLKPFSPETLRDALHATLAVRDHGEAESARHERLAARLQSDCARSLFAHWRALEDRSHPPLVERFDLTACSDPHRIVVAEVDLGRVPIGFHFLKIGDALIDDATAGESSVSGSETVASREAAYRRCALTGMPSYEFARIKLVEDQVETFERLLLPFSTDGHAVDRIVGTVVIARTQLAEDASA